jgi:hypothetical protein
MESKKHMHRILIAGAFLFASFVVTGQQNNSLYFLDRVPQSIQLNPALQPSSTFYFGIPFASTIEINAGNNFINVNDILIRNKETEKIVYPLYDKETTLMTLNKLGKSNMAYSGAQLDIISFGFKIKESYFSFLMLEKFSMHASFPKDLATFGYEGIDVGKSYSIDNMGINANYYREYSLGYSQKLSDRLSFGIRGKILFGKANITTRNMDISLNMPDWQTLEVSALTKVHSSIPNLEVYKAANGNPDSIKFRDFEHTSDLIDDMVLLRKNRGFGVDFGIQFQITEKISLAASVLDLGFINWKANVNTVSGGGDYVFKGIDLNRDSLNAAEVLLDTLNYAFDITATSDPYSTLLTPKLYVGFAYAPNRFVKVSLLSRSEYILKTFRQQVTGTLTMYPVQVFGATVSYTVANRMYDNLGIGFVFRGGPLQIYLMSERIPIFWNKVLNHDIPYLPIYARDINLRLGLNLVFGTNIARKLKKDQPFLE